MVFIREQVAVKALSAHFVGTQSNGGSRAQQLCANSPEEVKMTMTMANNFMSLLGDECFNGSEAASVGIYTGRRIVSLNRQVPSDARFVALDCLYAQLLEAKRDALEDGDTPPSSRAVKVAFCLLWKATQSLPVSLPKTCILYGDGCGGLRIEWASGDRQLRLNIHATDGAYDYLYHQEGVEYDIDTNIAPVNMAGWLRWLTGQIK